MALCPAHLLAPLGASTTGGEKSDWWIKTKVTTTAFMLSGFRSGEFGRFSFFDFWFGHLELLFCYL